MKLSNILLALIVGVLIAASITACSKGESPVEPVIDNVPISFGTESENRSVLAVYDAVIDPDKKTFTVEPANRTAEYHYPLSQLYPNTLEITAYRWTPNFWADIKLTHPFPGSGIDGFDPRVIAILPAYPGVSCNYPIFNVHANNSVVLEPDGYTKLFDSFNPSIPGNTNPFKSYFISQPNRVWSSTGYTISTRRWEMDINGFRGLFEFQLVVDVSTNYPNPPQPVVDNALEPVKMQIEISDGLTPEGGSATVTATFLDWQGPSDIKCKVESPDLFNGAVQLFYTEPGIYPNEYIFTGSISNDFDAPIGNYDVLLAAWDINVGNHLFKEAVARVNFAFDPVDVTPSGLIFTDDVADVFISDGYAYVTAVGTGAGFLIIDISPPESAFIVNSITTQDSAESVYVSGGYAYVADYIAGLQIIDIDPPESAYIVNTIDTPGTALDAYVSNGYAYVADYHSGLQIIDIDPLETAYIVNSIVDPNWASDVYATGGYAYVVDCIAGLQIIDVDPPESAYIITSVATLGAANGVYVTGGYAYVTALCWGLHIIDVDPPESACIVKSVDTLDRASGVYVTGSYAYLTDWYSGLQIINVDTIKNAYIFTSIDTPGAALDVYVADGYAYVADCSGGLRIIDLW